MTSPSRPDTDRLLAEAGFVHRLARALVRDQDLAHDVAQDALATALRVPPPQDLRSWLAAVTRRLAGRARRAAPERRQREALAAPPEDDDRVERTAERLRTHRRLTEAVLRLPEPYRTAVTMRFFDGLTPRAIAAQTRQSSSVVRQQVHRGIVLLRQQLDVEFGDRRAWLGAFVGAGWVGTAASPWLLVSVLTMKKFVAAAVCMVAFGSWWLWERQAETVAPAEGTADRIAAVAPRIAAKTDVAAEPAPARREVPPQRERLACDVEVVDDAESPIADATVHCWSPAGLLVDQRTDGQGRTSFASVSGPGGLVVRAAGRQPLLQVLDERLGSHRVVMPRSEVLAGRLLVDGAPAKAGWKLRLGGTRQQAVDPSVPKVVARLLTTTSDVRTTADGSFVFRGVAGDWGGWIELPQPLWLLPESGGRPGNERVFLMKAPDTNLVLLATQLPTIAGRVVWDDTGEPVVRPDIMAMGWFADGSNSPSFGYGGDELGRFAIGFYTGYPSLYAAWCKPESRLGLTKATLTVRSTGSEGNTRREVDAAELGSGGEIVVRLRRARMTHFLAVDTSGSPVPGARVSAHGISEPTGDDGRGAFSGLLKDVRLVGAPGLRIGPCAPRGPADGSAGDPVVFVLEPANCVRVQLRNPAGTAPIDLRVEIRSEAAAFAGRRSCGDLDRLLTGLDGASTSLGKQQPDGTTLWTDHSCAVQPDERGRVELQSLEPGLACVVAAVGALSEDFAVVPFVTPEPGQTLDLELLVAGTSRRLAGLVCDPSGAGVLDARVLLRRGDKEASWHTDVAGHFRVRGLHGDAPLSLTISAEGFACLSREGLTRADDRDDFVFQLEPGHIVTVRVLDETDTLVPASAGVVGLPGQPPCDPLRAGEVRWRDLPAGLVTFRCRIGGTDFEVQHDTARPDAILRVPRPARLLAITPPNWQKPANALGDPFVRVARLDVAEAPFPASLDRPEADAILLVPGRYRLDLAVHERLQGTTGDLTERVLGPTAEVTLVAGQLARVQLR